MSRSLRTDRAESERRAEGPAKSPGRELPPPTVSSRPIEPRDPPNDRNGRGGASDDRSPGQYPFTRGIHASMYRGRLWTMRQFAGFGTARQTNERFKFLLGKGQTGLSTAFDLPTLMGLDSDHPRAAGEVGRLGVAVDTLDDMMVLFDGIDLESTSVSMTINAPAIVLMAFYLAAAQERGFDSRKLRGTIQNDILKEFHAQNEFVFPPEPSVRLVCDVIEFCSGHVPQWNPVSISGYHIREAGSTAAQELAFTLADGYHYVEQCLARGLAVDAFAPRLSFFFNAHNDLFEEVAKYRAARGLWAEAMRHRYGATDEASWKLRFHAQTAGCSLQAQQPELNLVRVAYQALAAVLGGCQSLHTNSMDETLALPSEHAVTLALRTQQVLAYETGVTHTADPLGGSDLVEALTRTMQHDARGYFDRIASVGGMISAIEAGFFRREIADAAFAYQREVDAKRKLIVGLNAFVEAEEKPMETLTVDNRVESDQIATLRATRGRVEAGELRRCLDEVRRAAAMGQNLVGPLLQAAHARASVGEMMDALADVFGRYEPKGA
ncbi:methylmalonyl-CoA mutase [Singulisphaera sp. GP187]|uniref:acyl-CoA mutase large subunit family protein n=1 Tax=Singulisphaera sp. GP187 TaxID=1882752 RepID=UPI000925FA9A|nr:methylmalonyl-CoA mutase family protein [Singulisphaera sp. GP187]SIO62732.1 methylmalonyl-CoA mutase [Singulisphaera sp. GP187]